MGFWCYNIAMERIWNPSAKRIEDANITHFKRHLATNLKLDLVDYQQLWRWTVDNPVLFWGELFNYFNLPHSKINSTADITEEANRKIPTKDWFPDIQLNFAESLLRFHDSPQTALTAYDEEGFIRQVSYHELYLETLKVREFLISQNIKAGDRVCGFLNNCIEAVVAMLATTSLGAIWSSISTDFGAAAVQDRFNQISPKVLFVSTKSKYNGKIFDYSDTINRLKQSLPSIEAIIAVDANKFIPYCEIISRELSTEHKFERFKFLHPLYILYSSGTTGTPKAIIHSAGGTLLQHLKELSLHTDIKSSDTVFYYTTCGWMMWNWVVSSLALGAKIILYNGSPSYPDPLTLFRLIEKEKITIFGTSARFLSSCEHQGLVPKTESDLSSLKTILSTGSPLPPKSFEYVYRDIKEDLCLSSISGGTDIISCFALGNPTLPVYPGEIQCPGLGMNLQIYNEHGESVINESGELVCIPPFPSMPIGFWNDPGDEKYFNSYFATYPGVWRHGDWAKITPNGGVIIYGRSDNTLNPGGVRIGTAEIYRQLDGFGEIKEAVAVGQRVNNDERIILLLLLQHGAQLTPELTAQIKTQIGQGTTKRHIPELIIAVPDLPRTINGKISEIAVKKAINGDEITNLSALSNPESLVIFSNLKELKIDTK